MTHLASVPTPEGPYESEHWTQTFSVSSLEMVRFLDFAERLEDEADFGLALRSQGREMRMIIHLVRNHLEGKLVTNSALAAASGQSYGTAIRTIYRLVQRGLIIKRRRTSTGRSFSLHPSMKLLDQWEGFARRARILVGDVFRLHLEDANRNDVSPVGPSSNSEVVPPPAVLNTKLALGRALRALVHADPTFIAMSSLKRHFEMMLGVKIVSRAFSIDRLHEEIVRNSRLARSKYDIVACDLPWFGEMAAAGRLLALDQFMANSQFDAADFHDDALASTRFRGVQFGVPILTTAEILVYRMDLLADAGLLPPATVSETIDAARRLHDPKRGVAGIAWNGGRGTPVGHSFIMIMGAFGQPVINLRRSGSAFDAEHVSGEELRPMFLTDAAHETAEYLRRLLDYSPREILKMTWYDRALAYASGGAAMAYSHTLLAPLFELNEKSPAYRRTGYLAHPVGPRGRFIAPLGGYALAIPSNIAPLRVPSAWAAVHALTQPQAVKLYTTGGSLACPRLSVARDPEVRALSPMISSIDEMGRRGYMRMWPRPPVPEISEIIAIAGEEIHDFLAGAKSARDALRNAQNRADAVMHAHGHY